MKTTSEFEELVKATLPFNLPRIYVENYFNLKKKVKWFFPRKKAKIMLTANAYATNDGFKFWAAGQTEQYQTPFVILQHGGMSQSKWYSSEDYEKRICDYYLTYGWADKDNDKVIPFISNRLKFFNSQTVTGEVRGDILWVLNSYPRYAYSMFSGPAGSKFHDYLKEQTRFVSCLSHLTRQLLKCRPCSYEYGWHDLSYIEHHVGVLGQANARVSLGQLFKTMRLCVCTYNGTSVVEAFVANVPLIIYWNPQHVEVKDDMIDYFKTLHTLGILHFTPESAAVKVEEVKNNTFSWWERPNIQIFRKDYCERFAHASPNAAKEWGDMIKKLAKEKIT